jgi:hypothetical protein
MTGTGNWIRVRTAVTRLAWAAALCAVALGSAVTSAQAQVQRLYYQELTKDGRIYVFNTPERFKLFHETGDMGQSITLIRQGPNGETVVAENETALDLYNFKHNLPAYERPTPPPPAPSVPTALRIGENGELKFGALLQVWYIFDDSTVGTGTSWLGNDPGQNTFRIRRAELKASGKFSPDWGFEVMIDPAKNLNLSSGQDGKILQDLAISYLGFKGQEIAIGQRKIALTWEGLRSSSELDFAERAQIARRFGDRRQIGLFYKGEIGRKVVLYGNLTNGTTTNTNANSNDTLLSGARVDWKPVPGLLLGATGAYGQLTINHLERSRYGAHVVYDGTEKLPLWIRGEYMGATDEQADGTDVEADSFYLSALYTFVKKFRVGLRYDTVQVDKDNPDATSTIWTAGFAWLPKGKNVNFKFEWYGIDEPLRKVGGQPDPKYNEYVIAAQLAF